MKSSSKAIAVIPARGGSKRIPGKNIRNFSGKPIIAYSIQMALDSNLFERVIVSTDSPQISEIAEQFGAEVPFVRPDELGLNEVAMVDVMAHAVNELNLEEIDYACMISATAPLMSSDSLLEGWRRILANTDRQLVFAALPFGHPVHRGFELVGQSQPRMMWPEKYRHNSQDLPSLFHDANQFYFGRADMWRARPENLFGVDSEVVVLGRHEVVDIDTDDDWILAERLYRASLLIED